MAKIETSDAVLTARAKAAVGKYMKQIRAEIVKAAKKQGHSISDSNIKKVSFVGLKGTSYDIRSFKIGKFVITDPKNLYYLDHAVWTNNGAQTPTRVLEVDQETDDTYTWQISAGVTIKYETSTEAKIELPVGGSTRSTWSFQFNLNVTHGTAHTEKHAWKNEFNQPISPFSELDMTVYGVQVVGYSPFVLTAFASGSAHCKCVIKKGLIKREPEFDIDLGRILSNAERTFTSEGRISGIQGYDWQINTNERPLSEQEKKTAPRGVSGGRIMSETLRLPKLAA